jgi:CBS domain-containing protein
LTIAASATVHEAARRMRDSNVGMLPVLDGATVVGVITDRDLVVRVMSRDMQPSAVRVAEYVSQPPRFAEEDWTVDEAMEEMARQQVGRLPVLDPRGEVVGVVTLSSFALRWPKPGRTLETARHIARRSAVIVAPHSRSSMSVTA